MGSDIAKPNSVLKEPRPTLAGRRSTLKRSIDETNIMDVPSSPSKRSRVTFDSEVEIVSADEEEILDPFLAKEQVRRAIERHRIGDDEAYERIRSLFTMRPNNEDPPSSGNLRIHLQGVLANVSALTKECNGLVFAVVHSEWVGRDEKYFAIFVKFLNNLAAAQRGYQNMIMQMLVELLGPQKTRRTGGSKPVRQSKIHRRVLQAIQYVTTNVPSVPSALADKVAARLQFDFKKADDRMTYIRNFMEMLKYVPELTSEILTSIVRELIKLDVSAQAELDEVGDDAAEEIKQRLISLHVLRASPSGNMTAKSEDEDDHENTTTDESESEDEEELDADAARRRKAEENLDQVDLIMEMLFKYYDRMTSSNALQTRHNALEQLIAHFHTLILPTHRVRHAQFLIFHFGQGDPIVVDRFVTSCVQVLIDKKQPQVFRHSAAAYFSGFVGRGAHVSPSLVQDCVDLLCEQLNILRKFYEPICHGPDVKRFGDFYSVFQAIMYIFCFKWKDLALASRDLDDDSDLEEERVEQYKFPENFKDALRLAIYSELNPLRVCTPEICDQFAKLSWTLDVMYVYPKIEQNKRVRVATTSRTFSDLNISQPDRDLSWVGDNGMLEGHFPYDPYKLPRSKHWVATDYAKWGGIPGEEQDDTDSEDDGGMDVLQENDGLDDLDEEIHHEVVDDE